MPGTASNSTAASPLVHKPLFRAADVHAQAHDLVSSGRIWLTEHWLEILIASGVAAGIVLVLHTVRGVVARNLAKRPASIGWAGVLARAAVRTGNFFIVMLAAKLVGDTFAEAAPPPPIAKTIHFLWIVAASFQTATWARELILGAIERRTNGDKYHGEALASAVGIVRLLVTVALFAIATISVLDNLGVNVTGLVAGLGVGGVAIGLAAQGIFADLFAALAIIFDRPFRRGDTIAYDQTTGTVEEIGLKSTRIRAATGEERIISNKHLLDKEIQNITRRDYRRVIFTLGLVQWTPVEQMEALPALLKEVIEGADAAFVRVGFVRFGDSSYDFDVEFDSPDAAFAAFFDARHRVGLAIIARLNAEGIELAYPTQTQLPAPEAGTPPTAFPSPAAPAAP